MKCSKTVTKRVYLLRSILSAGWEDVRVAVEEVTETILITTLKEEQYDD